MSDDPILNVSDVTISYSGSVAVRDVSLEVPHNDVVGIIGPNGAGKSTLFDAIAGLKEYDGSISLDGTDIGSLKPNEIIESGLIYCTEDRDLFPYFSVRENLLMGAQEGNEHSIEDNLERVYDLFPRLEERMNQNAETMSGGEQQMLAIGRALMGEPDLLLLDEPTQGLAPIIIENISETIDRLEEEGISILIAEQNATFALKNANYLYLIETGDISLEGTNEDFRDDDHIRSSFIGV